MENSSTQLAKTSNYVDVTLIKSFEDLAERIKDSALAKEFVINEYPTGEDGKPDITKPPIRKVNIPDIVTCLSIGYELGIPPMIALSYGSRLDLKAIKKIEKGKKLGLDYSTSLEQIYIWGEGSKEIIYTSIHIVNSALTKANIKREILEDGTTPIVNVMEYETGKIVEFNPLVHTNVALSQLSQKESDLVISKLKETGKIACLKLSPIYRAKVRLTRYNSTLRENEVIETPYSSQQAIDAGLLKGTKSDGTESKGKDNWNNHVATHLIKMCIMIGGRIIASDILNGISNECELIEIKTKDSHLFEEAEEVKETD